MGDVKRYWTELWVRHRHITVVACGKSWTFSLTLQLYKRQHRRQSVHLMQITYALANCIHARLENNVIDCCNYDDRIGPNFRHALHQELMSKPKKGLLPMFHAFMLFIKYWQVFTVYIYINWKIYYNVTHWTSFEW